MSQKELELKSIEISPVADDLFDVHFITSRGSNKAILHHKEGNRAGTILIGGAGGGFDGPANTYRELSLNLLDKGISSLRLDFRECAVLHESILDVLIGIELLKSLDIRSVGLVGWSFGGAVVITAGAINEMVAAVVTIASQTAGADMANQLSPKPILLIHGTNDNTLPVACSQDLYAHAKEPKELVIYEGANHGIDEKREEMLQKVEEFLVSHLKTA